MDQTGDQNFSLGRGTEQYSRLAEFVPAHQRRYQPGTGMDEAGSRRRVGADAIPEWMKGVEPAEQPSAAAQPAESMPDWLQESAAPASKPVELVPEWMRTETPPSGRVSPCNSACRPGADRGPSGLDETGSERSPDFFPVVRTGPRRQNENLSAGKRTVRCPGRIRHPEAAIPDWMKPPSAESAALWPRVRKPFRNQMFPIG